MLQHKLGNIKPAIFADRRSCVGPSFGGDRAQLQHIKAALDQGKQYADACPEMYKQHLMIAPKAPEGSAKRARTGMLCRTCSNWYCSDQQPMPGHCRSGSARQQQLDATWGPGRRCQHQQQQLTVMHAQAHTPHLLVNGSWIMQATVGMQMHGLGPSPARLQQLDAEWGPGRGCQPQQQQLTDMGAHLPTRGSWVVHAAVDTQQRRSDSSAAEMYVVRSGRLHASLTMAAGDCNNSTKHWYAIPPPRAVNRTELSGCRSGVDGRMAMACPAAIIKHWHAVGVFAHLMQPSIPRGLVTTVSSECELQLPEICATSRQL